MSPNLTGKICIVTGGSKGIGKGIALQLGQAGATVYVTGRKKPELEGVTNEIKSRGGRGIPVVCDHSNDEAVEALFKKVSDENNGKLDVLVNNAYAGVILIGEQRGTPFWTNDPVKTWDTINGVGLRNHYLCTTYAGRLMSKNKDGLIINITSGGGLIYLFNCAYGIGKAAVDKMATDCGTELKKQNVTMVALCPGPVKTERIADKMTKGKVDLNVFEDAETTEFAGIAAAHLAADQNKINKAAKVLLTADLALEYGFVDLDGGIHGDFKSLKYQLNSKGWKRTAAWMPPWLRIPSQMLYYWGYKY